MFVLPLDHLLFARKNNDDSTLTIGGMFPRESVRRQLFQNSMFMEFGSAAERDEWAETLGSVVTDRSVRAAKRNEEVRD